MTSYAKSCVPHVESSNDDKTKARWIISAPALHLLEQVFKMEHFPSLHMRQRLAADLNVSARQVRSRRDQNWGERGGFASGQPVLRASPPRPLTRASAARRPRRSRCGSRTAVSATATS